MLWRPRFQQASTSSGTLERNFHKPFMAQFGPVDHTSQNVFAGKLWILFEYCSTVMHDASNFRIRDTQIRCSLIAGFAEANVGIYRDLLQQFVVLHYP
jgi:hypothetical protein